MRRMINWFDEKKNVLLTFTGDGEIIEEIVSASRQKEINKAATMGDGQSFQNSLKSALNQWYSCSLALFIL